MEQLLHTMLESEMELAVMVVLVILMRHLVVAVVQVAQAVQEQAQMEEWAALAL